MNDEQAKRADHALRLYGEWLTTWMRRGPVPDNDTADITASSFSYEILYDSIERAVLNDPIHAGIFQGCRIIVLTCDYGDDGGPSDLLCFFDQSDYDGMWDNLRHILQGFDTNLSMIYQDFNFNPELMPDWKKWEEEVK